MLVFLDFISKLLDSTSLKSLNFNPTDVEFKFVSVDPNFEELKNKFNDIDFEVNDAGTVITISRYSRSKDIKIFQSYSELFDYLYSLESDIENTSSYLVIDKEQKDIFYYDYLIHKEYFIKSELPITSWISNYKKYTSLLKLFLQEELVSEFHDKVKKKVVIVEAGNEKKLVRLTYAKFDKRVFTKDINFDYNYLYDHITNKEWLSSFKHNIVSLIDSQEDNNKTISEIFLNISFIISNTDRDFEIYVSNFSFDKITKKLKEEKKHYFDELNQAQEKILSQIISVPISLGTSVFSFFQIKEDKNVLYFLIIVIGFYTGFIFWYLRIYDNDLKKLNAEINSDTEKFNSYYPKIYILFKKDFTYIINKVSTVLKLSFVLKFVLITNLVVLIIYTLFFFKADLTNITKGYLVTF